MKQTSNKLIDDLLIEYNMITKEHKNQLKLLIKCGMHLGQPNSDSKDEGISKDTNNDFEQENEVTKEMAINLATGGANSMWAEFEDHIHQFHQQNNRMRYLFVQFWSHDINSYQKLLQYEMTMLENTKIQFTHNFFNRYCLQENKDVIEIYRKILELFFISEISLICGFNYDLDDFSKSTLEGSIPVENVKSDLDSLKSKENYRENSENESQFLRLKTQIQTNIKEIRQMSEKFDSTSQTSKNVTDMLRKQRNIAADEDTESIESVEKNFYNEIETPDIPVCVENFIEKIKAYQSLPVAAKITGYRFVTTENSTFYQFCVKIKVKHAFYEIWRRYNSFRKLHTDLCAISPSVGSCFFPHKLSQIPTESLLKYRKVVLEDYLNTILDFAFEGKIGKFSYCKNNNNGGPNLNQLHPFFDPHAQDFNLL